MILKNFEMIKAKKEKYVSVTQGKLTWVLKILGIENRRGEVYVKVSHTCPDTNETTTSYYLPEVIEDKSKFKKCDKDGNLI